MSIRKPLTLILATTMSLAACASPDVVDRKQVDDQGKTCSELSGEIGELEQFKRDITKEKGVTGKNVAAALFFWPAIVGTYMNVDKAMDAAEYRRDHLMDLYDDKQC